MGKIFCTCKIEVRLNTTLWGCKRKLGRGVAEMLHAIQNDESPKWNTSLLDIWSFRSAPGRSRGWTSLNRSPMMTTHQMSVAWRGGVVVGPQVWCWKHYLPTTSFAVGKNDSQFSRSKLMSIKQCACNGNAKMQGSYYHCVRCVVFYSWAETRAKNAIKATQ